LSVGIAIGIDFCNSFPREKIESLGFRLEIDGDRFPPPDYLIKGGCISPTGANRAAVFRNSPALKVEK